MIDYSPHAIIKIKEKACYNYLDLFHKIFNACRSNNFSRKNTSWKMVYTPQPQVDSILIFINDPLLKNMASLKIQYFPNAVKAAIVSKNKYRLPPRIITFALFSEFANFISRIVPDKIEVIQFNYIFY